MSATIVDGKTIAARVYEKVAADVAGLATPPGLATVLVGEDRASAIYVRNKRKRCVEAGMRDMHRHLTGDITQEAAVAVIDELASDPEVTGILVQLPLPPHLNGAALIDRIPAGKDVDGLTETSAGRLALGRAGLRPSAPPVYWCSSTTRASNWLARTPSSLAGRISSVNPWFSCYYSATLLSPCAIHAVEMSRPYAAKPTCSSSRRVYPDSSAPMG